MRPARPATRPASITRPAGAVPRVPPGFTVALWAAGLDEPRAIRIAPNGDIFVAESGAGAHPRLSVRARMARSGPSHGLRQRASTSRSASPSTRRVRPALRLCRRDRQGGALSLPVRATATARGPAETIVPRLPDRRALDARPRLLARRHAAFRLGRLGLQRWRPAHATPPGGWPAWSGAHGLGAAWGDEAGRADVLALRPGRAPRPRPSRPGCATAPGSRCSRAPARCGAR